MRHTEPGRRTMRWLVLAAAGLAMLPAASVRGAGPPGFTVELDKLDSSGLPGLHSYSLAQANGKWLVVGGRTNGMHELTQSSDGGATPPPNAFPPSKANQRVWVIEPAATQAWSTPVQNLDPAIADQMSATNAQHVQDGNVLYIIGGYGQDSSTGQMVTFGSLLVIQVQETINAIVAGQPISGYIQRVSTYTDCPQYGTDAYNACVAAKSKDCKTGPGWAACMKKVEAECWQGARREAEEKCIQSVQAGDRSGYPTNDGYYAQVTGGGMEQVGNVFYLVFGQLFEGLYSANEGDYGKWPVRQIYTERVVALNFTPGPPAKADVLTVYKQDPNDDSAPYHRRDLNVLPALNPVNGATRIAVHGGVFVPGQDAAYREPIYLDNGADPTTLTITVDRSCQQVMSQYECGTLTMFDRTGGGAGNMINVCFGGISLYYLSPPTKTLKMDTGLPFIQDLTAMTHYPDGSYTEYVRMKPLDGRMGTDARFVPMPGVSATEDGVIYLDTLKAQTLVGYLYGGIFSQTPDPALGGEAATQTRASNAIYQVWVSPQPAPPGYWIPAVPPTSSTAKTPAKASSQKRSRKK